MKVDQAVIKVIDLAKSQVGYKPTSGKHTKYAKELDALGTFYNTPKDGYDWCDVWFDWLFVKSFGPEVGRKMLYQPLKSLGAGVGFSKDYYIKNGAFSTKPQVGSQIFFGNSHTGIVTGFDAGYVYTIEGNTGGGNGEVKRKIYKRDTSSISGYGIPNWKLVLDIPDSSKDEKDDLDTIDRIAREVIAGKWGNGVNRKKKLEASGYNYNHVQARVNYMLTHKSIDTVAREVIAGKWGNGTNRKKKLEAAGYDYNKVQKRVNEILN